MSSAAKLKKQALELEHDRQPAKALAIYARLLDGPGAPDEEVDVALFNRAGDLALRVGDTARAVTYYERAVDLYAAGGLLNNAIALCNKILRHAPDHVASHFTLGVLNAKQGFRGDAKHHYVEYAERMHRAGRDDEALRALRDFAELCAPGDDARALLTQLLARSGRGTASAATLQAMLDTAGIPLAHAAGPPPAPLSTTEPPAEARAEGALVFLDLSGDVAGESTVEPFTVEPTIAFEVMGAEPWAVESPASGSELVSWDLPSHAGDVDAPAGEPLATLPGELPPLTFPLPRAADAFVAVADVAEVQVEPSYAPDPVDAFDGALPLLDLDDPSRVPLGAIDLAPMVSDPVEREHDPVLLVDFAPDGEEISPLAEQSDTTHELSPALPLLFEPEGESETDVAVAPPVDSAAQPVESDEQYVDLGAWLRELEPAPSPRMVTADVPQTGDESADFDRMLQAFKAGIDRNIEGGDYDSHYDLGVAFRDMGLLEEAATQFQRAARAPGRPLRALEALGDCFVALGRPELALESLGRALGDGVTENDEQLVGVLYLLGVASEHTQRPDAAATYYRRVCALDLTFRDAARRLAQLSPPSR